jgi:type IV pilus assembly protein PilM
MANPLSSLFSGFFKRQGTSVLGIDIGSSSIKVVQLRKDKGRAILETYGELSLGPYGGVEIGRATNLPQEKIISALSDVIKESNVTTKDCGISIPSSSSLLSFIHMPVSDKAQLAVMVPIEARKYVPVPISEVSLDYWPVPKEENSFSEFEKTPGGAEDKKDQGTDIVLVVIHNDVLNRLSSIASSTGLTASFFEIEIFSSMRSVVEQSLDAELVFDMGAGSTKLYIIDRTVLRSSHTINRGSQEITLALSRSLGVPVGEAEHIKRTIGFSPAPEHKNIREIIDLNLDYIFSETNRVIANYQRHYNKNLSRVILTGGGSLLKGFLEAARARFQTEVVLGDPFGKTEAPAFLTPVLKNSGPEFAVAIGIALRQLQELE